jgi:hypothetical protein
MCWFQLSWHLFFDLSWEEISIKMYAKADWCWFRRFSTICLCCIQEQPSTCDTMRYIANIHDNYKRILTSSCRVLNRCESKSAFASIPEPASRTQISCHQRLHFARDNHEDTKVLKCKRKYFKFQNNKVTCRSFYINHLNQVLNPQVLWKKTCNFCFISGPFIWKRWGGPFVMSTF